MAEPDFYAALGVKPSASADEIKAAYRAIAKRYHPDRNPGDAEAEQIFKAAAEAYRVLSDPDRRKDHDRQRSPAGLGEDPMDLFTEIFGTRRRDRRPARPRATGQRGDDQRYTLELDFEAAALGTKKEISVPRRARCPRCGGTGARVGTVASVCHRCSGAGSIRVEEQLFSVPKPCPVCRGSGRVIPDPCDACDGAGESQVPHRLEVRVPAGVDSGTRLKLAGEGEPGTGGGAPGDLYVVVEVRPHPFFRREGLDVVSDLWVRLDEAALGATVDVPTLDGLVRMRVPPGSEPGRTFRLKGRGIAGPDGKARGDQRIVLAVEVPEHLTAEQRALLARFGELEEAKGEGKVREHRERLKNLGPAK